MISLPDTYVKVYLLQGRAKFQKKKTKTVKSMIAPSYNETFEFSNGYNEMHLALEVQSRESFGRKSRLGEAQINLSNLDLTVRLTAWYRLFFSHPSVLQQPKK